MEDDIDLATQWRTALAEVDIQADHVTGTAQANRQCGEVEYDVVIVDMFIRERDGSLSPDGGLVFIAHLRSPTLAGTPVWGVSVPIIAITGSPEHHKFDVLDNAHRMGADDLLRKPIEPEDLVSRVQFWLKQHS